MMMSDLPADLVEEILSRVPAKSLKRLRYTCKQWNTLFKNRVFTENHFRKAAKQSMVLLLKNYRVCLMSVNLNVVAPSIEFKGELSLEHSHSSSEKVDIISVFHCDGLLLCTTKDNELVVWNPCLEETRWIQHKSNNKKAFKCALGYQNNNSRRSYKILRCWRNDNYVVRFEIYEFSSDSWRVFDNDSMYYSLINPTSCMSLKGNTYWLTLGYSIFLLSFDFTKERFKRLCLPPNLEFYTKEVLSIVREEQLSLLIPNYKTLKMEIWMTKNIDTEATLSWWKSFTVDIQYYNSWSDSVRYGFLIDEEKRVVVCCNGTSYGYIVDIIGEDDEYKTKLPFEASTNCSPFIFNYAPSLVQIQREKNRR